MTRCLWNNPTWLWYNDTVPFWKRPRGPMWLENLAIEYGLRGVLP